MVSDLLADLAAYVAVPRLNPCSNGIWSLTIALNSLVQTTIVLILVLMEYGL